VLLESGAWRVLRPLLDEVWWLEAPPQERSNRLVRRKQFGKSYDAAGSWVRDVDGVTPPSSSQSDPRPA